MGIDLDALANELRAAGGNVRVSESMLCLELPYDLMAPLKTVVVVHDNGAVTLSMDEQGRPRSTVYVDQKLNAALAIIARHFGAGHPVAADRAALVERMAEAAWNENDRSGRRFERALPEQRATYLRSSSAALAAVEAAGWGPRAEPVAPPEPLSAGEFDTAAKAAYYAAYGSSEDDQDRTQHPGTRWEFLDTDKEPWIDATRAVLAALPERYAVPVEGA